MTTFPLDQAKDPIVLGLARLCQIGVNYKLAPGLGVDPIPYVYGTPLPLSLLLMNKLPALSVYRFETRDRDLGDHLFEEETVFHFDYYTSGTPLNRIEQRWPLLSSVWQALLATVRAGRHPELAKGQDLQLGRYVLGSARAQFAFVPGAEQTYPSFRGQLTLQNSYDPPAILTDSDLGSFDLLYSEMDLSPSSNVQLEAKDNIRPNG